MVERREAATSSSACLSAMSCSCFCNSIRMLSCLFVISSSACLQKEIRQSVCATRRISECMEFYPLCCFQLCPQVLFNRHPRSIFAPDGRVTSVRSGHCRTLHTTVARRVPLHNCSQLLDFGVKLTVVLVGYRELLLLLSQRVLKLR